MSRALASEQFLKTAAHTRRRPIVLRFHCTVALLACGVAAVARPAFAAESACSAEAGPAGRPSVGLVLSGGGARGYAHLGVLKVLEENRIPVDCIAATSMGSVVGGLYASGMTAQDMQTASRASISRTSRSTSPTVPTCRNRAVKTSGCM